MEKPLLYTFRRCPYAMRARLAIDLAGFDHQKHEVSLKDKPAHMLDISPKGTVPILQLTDGTVIDESLDIMRFVLAESPVLTAMPTAAWGLTSENDGAFKHALDRYKYPSRYPDALPVDYRELGVQFLMKLEVLLAQNQYLYGPEPALADYAIFPFVRQFSKVEPAWWDTQMPCSRVKKWLAGWLASDIFDRIMAKK